MTRSHWKLLAAAGAGAIAGFAAPALGAPRGTQLLIGWVVAASLYIGLLWRLFLDAGEAEVRANAAREDENRGVILAIVLALVGASLVAIVAALIGAKNGDTTLRIWTASLAGLTLVASWLMLQSVFVAHYAHRYFGDDDRDGKINKGLTFPGEPAKTYMDFVYLSFCIGATFQVSDTTVETTRLRNLITTHAAVCYFYNTAILALGINIIAGVVSQ